MLRACMRACYSLQEIMSAQPVGVIPRLLNVLFNYIQLASENYEVTLKVRRGRGQGVMWGRGGGGVGGGGSGSGGVGPCRVQPTTRV